MLRNLIQVKTHTENAVSVAPKGKLMRLLETSGSRSELRLSQGPWASGGRMGPHTPGVSRLRLSTGKPWSVVSQNQKMQKIS